MTVRTIEELRNMQYRALRMLREYQILPDNTIELHQHYAVGNDKPHVWNPWWFKYHIIDDRTLILDMHDKYADGSPVQELYEVTTREEYERERWKTRYIADWTTKGPQYLPNVDHELTKEEYEEAVAQWKDSQSPNGAENTLTQSTPNENKE